MRHPSEKRMTAALGTKFPCPLPSTRKTLSPGDVVILCTDGLTGLVSSKEIRDMTSVLGRKEIAQRFVDTANERGGYDNVTVVLMWPDVEGVPCG